MIKVLKKQRWNRIVIIYNYYLLGLSKDEATKIAFEEYKLESNVIDQLETIFQNINEYEKKLLLNLKTDWKWQRINHLIKAILINAIFEINTNLTMTKIVISESIILSKRYGDEEAYKLVNGILDKCKVLK